MNRVFLLSAGDICTDTCVLDGDVPSCCNRQNTARKVCLGAPQASAPQLLVVLVNPTSSSSNLAQQTNLQTISLNYFKIVVHVLVLTSEVVFKFSTCREKSTDCRLMAVAAVLRKLKGVCFV